ncbi:MAG: mandelate racemase/muconate lactonizing enzyme family protein [Candidatus Latescibacterota bacterium]|nr:mandelate racemase/muconate lactonizing enzyme family protein [Candidatus Latescibacterota bacterium]
MKVTGVERIVIDVPFTERQKRITRRTVYNWSVLELCRVTSDSSHVGWGETIVHYTHQRVTDASVNHVIGKSPAALLFDDGLGAGLQMALFDLVGRITETPVHALLGQQVREQTPISWWCSHASPQDWAAEAVDAVATGYTSFKTKPRPWWDVFTQIAAVERATPAGFKVDLDPNASMINAAAAIPIMQRLEERDIVAMFETPIPQTDILGNRQIRQVIQRPIAMHFGSPPYITGLREKVCDGFVINGGASRVLRQGSLAAEAEMPFWLQLVGNGLTTTWAAHLGAVLGYAIWPAISCINLYSHDLLQRPLKVRSGHQLVPVGPGLGVKIDESAVDRFRVPEESLRDGIFTRSVPRLINSVIYQDGSCIHTATMGVGLLRAMEGQFWSEGVRVESWEDDGSEEWDRLYERLQLGPVRDRWQGGRQ